MKAPMGPHGPPWGCGPREKFLVVKIKDTEQRKFQIREFHVKMFGMRKKYKFFFLNLLVGRSVGQEKEDQKIIKK